jgi:hypothetical protein
VHWATGPPLTPYLSTTCGSSAANLWPIAPDPPMNLIVLSHTAFSLVLLCVLLTVLFYMPCMSTMNNHFY